MRDFIYSTPKPFFALPLCSTHNVKRSRKISERIISLSAVQHMRRSRLLFFPLIMLRSLLQTERLCTFLPFNNRSFVRLEVEH